MKLRASHLIGFRQVRHRLHARAPAGAALEVASALCGLQAQVLSCAELMLWARVETLPHGFVAKALWEERSLLKTWAMRGTLHLLPSKEYGLWQAALSTYRHYLRPSWLRYMKITAAELERLMEAVGVALDARPHTRAELAAAVEAVTSKRVARPVRDSWGMALKPASFRGKLCFGPSRGQNVTFINPRDWLGGVPKAATAPEAALSEVLRRFFSAHGPAPVVDLSRWWGFQGAEGKRALQLARDELCEVEVDGEAAYALAKDRDELRNAAPVPGVRLIPGFDQYTLVASGGAARFLPHARHRRQVFRNQGWISAVVLVDGKMAGVWKHGRKGKSLRVGVEPFTTLPARTRRAAGEEAERLAAFLGAPELELRWS
ncbi:MAG TPA: winged helix DNA-binding domain-containing protein [Myxococcaceae bacterium]|jgi:hypothetical protein